MAELGIKAARRPARGEKSERRIESLLSTAKAIFAEKGFERSTTLEIAQRCGVSEATVFTYFGSKREICLEVIRRWYDEISTEIEQELPRRSSLRDQLHFAIHKHLTNLMGEGAGICALVLSEGRTADRAFAEVIANLKRRYTAPLMGVLEAARKSGEVRSEMPLRLLRDMIYGSMEHVLWDYIESGRKPDIDRTAADLCDGLWGGLRPAEGSMHALADFKSDVETAFRRFEQSARS